MRSVRRQFTFSRLNVSKVVKGIPAHWSRLPTHKNLRLVLSGASEWVYINYRIM